VIRQCPFGQRPLARSRSDAQVGQTFTMRPSRKTVVALLCPSMEIEGSFSPFFFMRSKCQTRS